MTSVIATYRQRITAKPYVPSIAYRRSTLSTNGVPNKFFLLFSEHVFWSTVFEGCYVKLGLVNLGSVRLSLVGLGYVAFRYVTLH